MAVATTISRRARTGGADGALVACGALLILLSVPVLVLQGDALEAPAATALASVAGGVCIALARRHPLGAILGFSLALTVAVLLGSELEDDNGLLLIASFVLPVSWAAGVDHRVFVRTLPLVVLLYPLPVVLHEPSAAGSTLVFILLIPIGLGAAAGRLMRWHGEAALALARQAAELDANREARAAAAVSAERARIAVDLHDLIAHDVSVMAVQAQAAEHLVTTRDVEGADRAIGRIEQTGRGALAETRHLLGVLRQGEGEPALTPHAPMPVLAEQAQGLRAGPGPRPARAARERPRARLAGGRLLTAARRHGIEWPDVLIVALLMVVGFADTVIAPAADLGAHGTLAALGMIICPLPLLVMRRHAAASLLGVSSIVLVVHLAAADVTDLFTPIATMTVAAFAAGANTDPPRSYELAAVLPLVVVVAVLTSGTADLEGMIFPSLVFLAAWLAGRLVHGRAQVAQRLERQTAQLERERDELAQAAVARERARIARELHDVIAHSVSAMVIQAGAARRVLPRSAAESAAALRQVQEVGREALAELHRTLGFLRPDEAQPVEQAPAPTLAGVAELVDGARAAGLPVELHVRGTPGRLPASSDLAAYRIVQEALTNALKHAGRAHATVLLDWREDALVLDVRDTGAGSAERDRRMPASGHGLVGMRERAELAGGTLEAGPARGGGFRVRARIPRTGPEPLERELEEAQPA